MQSKRQAKVNTEQAVLTTQDPLQRHPIVPKTHLRNNCVNDVVKTTSQTNVQLRMLLVLSVIIRATSVHNAFQTAATSELTMDTFLGVMSIEGDSTWFISLTLESQEMSFKLDAGTEVTAISEGAFNKLENVTLQAPSKILFGPTCKALKVLGQFNGTFHMGQKESSQRVFIVRGLKANLLGLPAIKSIQVLKCVDTVPSTELSIQQIPESFSQS